MTRLRSSTTTCPLLSSAAWNMKRIPMKKALVS